MRLKPTLNAKPRLSGVRAALSAKLDSRNPQTPTPLNCSALSSPALSPSALSPSSPATTKTAAAEFPSL